MGQVVFDVPILSDASVGDAINVGGDEIDRLASSGWVEDWRHTPQVQPIRCSPFPLGVPHEPNRQLVSSPPTSNPSCRFQHWAYLLASY
jgi:hypothetical protein